MSRGRRIITDPNAASTDADRPGFLARPSGAPIYHGFPVVEESNTDGWCIGVITEYVQEEAGDAFVIAPDGSRAGLVWEVGDGVFAEILPPSSDRWGVYAVWFPAPMLTVEDLVANFRRVLADLKIVHKRVRHDG